MLTQVHLSYYKSYFMDPITPRGFHMDILLESGIMRTPKMHLKMFYASITFAARVIV